MSDALFEITTGPLDFDEFWDDNDLEHLELGRG